MPALESPQHFTACWIGNGNNGFLVKRDTASFAHALGQLRDMDRHELRRNARQSVLNSWTWTQQAQKYTAMFKELAELRHLKSGRFDRVGNNDYMRFLLREGMSRLAWAFRYTPLWRTARHWKIRKTLI